MMDRIFLETLCGYATEKTAWTVLADISAELVSLHGKDNCHGNVCSHGIFLGEGDVWHLSPSQQNGKGKSSDIWQLGATVFELLMGVPVFGGRGEECQTKQTPIPTFRRDRYDASLGEIVGRCLQYDPASRPDAETVHAVAVDGLAKCISLSGNRIPKDAVHEKKVDSAKFWPEKMV